MDSSIEDTTMMIWDWYFKVSVPYMQTRSVEDIRQFGARLSDVPEVDKDINNQFMTTMKTIAQMIDLYKEGVTIRVIDPNDITTIYECVSKHIYAWREQINTKVNIGDAPLQDLILMDEFAHSIYPNAKYDFTIDPITSITTDALNAVTPINANNLFAKPLSHLNKPTDTIRINQDDAEVMERDSLGSFFKDKLTNNRRFR